MTVTDIYDNPSGDNLRIASIHDVAFPRQVMEEFPVSDKAAELVRTTRRAVHKVLNSEDDRLIVIVGPCSIHNADAATEYAKRLVRVKSELSENLLIIMRVYFEKPRTTIGWKGLINDPDLDGSFDINKGLRLARRLMLEFNNLGVPAGVEFLDIITPQYIGDLVSWGAIGARTTESQVHRQLASGLSCPVGLKNGTDGNINIAVDGVHAASKSHRFLSITTEGQTSIFETSGNTDCHIILRGGKQPNYDAESVRAAAEQLESRGLQPNLMIDFSHANSSKKYERQMLVGEDVAGQIAGGDQRIKGVMIESHLVEGRQDLKDGLAPVYGQSITDACIGWDKTYELLRTLSDAVASRREHLHAVPAFRSKSA